MSEKNKNNPEVDNSEDLTNTMDADTQEKLKSLEDKLLRALAENENLRRRYENEVKEALEFGGINFAREILAVADNLNRAYEFIKKDESFKKNNDYQKILDNILIIQEDTKKIFEKNKIVQIKTLNEKFDPNYHQAMLEIEDDKNEPGIVVQELQSGYLMGEKLLRPALVAVSKKGNN